jgi:hypothetical protein
MFKQIVRGCTDLPYVGEHPGVSTLIMFIIMGGLAGAKGGLFGVIGGVSLMLVFVLPIFLYGAYDRANESDLLVKRAKQLSSEQ